MADLQATDTGDEFDVIIRSRIYHADLLEAARKLGGIKFLAKDLGLCTHTVSDWVSLKRTPSLVMRRRGKDIRNRHLADKWERISKRLWELTGKTVDELFPDFTRLPAFLDMPKAAEFRRTVKKDDVLALASNVGQRRLEGIEDRSSPSPAEDVANLIGAGQLWELIDKNLSHRERTILGLRYGRDGVEPHTYRQCADVFNLSFERVRQIEAKALRKLRDLGGRAKQIRGALAELLDVHPCPGCNEPTGHFSFCGRCGVALCGSCLSGHSCLKASPRLDARRQRIAAIQEAAQRELQT